MKKDIHPQIFEEVTVTCACGNSFVTQSAVSSIAVDICSKCHPLYTGKQKFIDTEGRIDKFNKRKEVAKQKTQATKETSKKSEPTEQKSLKEMLKATQK